MHAIVLLYFLYYLAATRRTGAPIGLTWGHFSDGDNEVLFIVQ